MAFTNTTIANLSLQCTQKFQAAKRDITASSSSDNNPLPGGFSTSAFLDVFARFRIWTGNIGALQRGRASLDHRIRDTNIYNEVGRLLGQVMVVLGDLAPILKGEREQQTWYEGEGIMTDYVDSSDSESENESISVKSEERLLTPDEEDPRLVTESGQLLIMLEDLVRSLLKLSLLIGKSSRRSKFARSSREKPYETKFDILHVLESFPYASSNAAFIEKLGKANAQRRQWLSYRRRHRERLSSANVSTAEQLSEPSLQSAEIQSQPPTDLASTTSYSSHHPLSALTVDNSTVATTFYDSIRREPVIERLEEDSSEISFSASSISGREKVAMEIPRLPAEAASGEPFECPLCFLIITVQNLQSWIKHVHADLASYVCTFENCTEPPFESRLQWFAHEMEAHRRIWLCPLCELQTTSMNQLENHLRENHSNRVSPNQIRAMACQASHPLQRLPASSCPLCDYNATLKKRLLIPNPPEIVMIKAEQLRGHLGRHLEQLALFVLPKGALMHDREEEGDDLDSENEDTGAGDSEDDAENQEAHPLTNIGDIASILAEQSGRSSHILNSAPALALGWQPPHDFTPPAEEFETDDDELIPRREQSTFGGDLFTPGWVRGYDKNKEGYCARCDVGHWVNIPSGTYEFHLTYLHGLPYTGLPLPRPSAIRETDGKPGSWEAFCDMCQGWRELKRTERGWNWWRHCLTVHESIVNAVSTKSTGAVATEVSTEELNMIPAIKSIHKADLDVYKSILNNNPLICTTKDSQLRALTHYAAEAGRTDFITVTMEAIKSLNLQDGVESALNARSHKGLTPMMLAAEQGNYNVVEDLLRRGADLRITSNDGRNVLDFAAHAGHAAIAGLLIGHGAKIEESRTFREVYLTRGGDSPRKKISTVSKGVEESVAFTWSKLMELAAQNDIAGIQECLKQGADIEAAAKDGRTAFMIAIKKGNFEAAEVLIENGANINATNSKGWTALMTAVRDANYSTVHFLLDRGADANHLSPDHWTALAEAAQSGSIAILEILLEHGADTEARSSHDWTPLMHACYRGDNACVHSLLQAGASIESGSERDETPMLLAAAAGHTEIVRILLDAGGLPDAAWALKSEVPYGQESIERTYQLGWTPIMTACQNGHEKIVRLLLNAGANIEPRSPLKKNTTEIAKENGRTSILALLENYSSRTPNLS